MGFRNALLVDLNHFPYSMLTMLRKLRKPFLTLINKSALHSLGMLWNPPSPCENPKSGVSDNVDDQQISYIRVERSVRTLSSFQMLAGQLAATRCGYNQIGPVESFRHAWTVNVEMGAVLPREPIRSYCLLRLASSAQTATTPSAFPPKNAFADSSRLSAPFSSPKLQETVCHSSQHPASSTPAKVRSHPDSSVREDAGSASRRPTDPQQTFVPC